MLDFINRHRSTVLGTFFAGLLSLSMLGFGIDILFNGNTRSNSIQVNNTEIPVSNYFREKKLLENQYRSMYGPQYNQIAKMLNISQQASDKLVQQELLLQASKALGLAAPTAQNVKRKMNEELFPNGFDKNRYRSFLATTEMSAQEFEEDYKNTLIQKQFVNILRDAVEPTDSEVKKAIIKDKSVHTVRALTSNFDFYTKGEFRKVDDKELSEYLKANSQQFMTKASADYDYIVIDEKVFPNLVEILPEDVQSYYEQNKEKFQTRPKIQFKLIQLDKPKDKEESKDDTKNTEKELKEVKKDARELAKLINDGFPFADAVKLYSTDEATRKTGGLSKIYPQGSLKPELETKLWNKGISDKVNIIETADSLYITQVVNIVSAKTKPLSEVDGIINSILKRETAPTLISAKANEIYDEMVNNNSSLKSIAKKLGVTIDSLSNATAGTEPKASNGQSLFGVTQKVLAGKDEKKQLIESGASAVITSLKKYNKAKTPELKSAKEKVLKSYLQKNSRTLAKENLETLLKALPKKGSEGLSSLKLDGNIKLSKEYEIKPNEKLPEVFNGLNLNQLIQESSGKPGVIRKVLDGAKSSALVEITKSTPPSEKEIKKDLKNKKGQIQNAKLNKLLISLVKTMQKYSVINKPLNLIQ